MAKSVPILDTIKQVKVEETEQLLTEVYQELRRLAIWKMAHERSEQTLQPSDLVHEACLRLLQDAPHPWNSRKHFINAVSEAMRRILIESARKRNCLKRNGAWKRIPLNQIQATDESEAQSLVLVDEALDSLALEDPFKAKLVRLRFFTGMGNTELAMVLGVSEPTVKRHWANAREWLGQEIRRLRT